MKALQKQKQNNTLLPNIIQLFLTHPGCNVGIAWTKTHVGTASNELVDSLVKQAASLDFQGF